MFRQRVKRLQKLLADFFIAEKMEEHKQVLAQKKHELNVTSASLVSTINETRMLTVSIIDKLRQDTQRLKMKLKSTVDENVNKGIIFIDYRGTVLFANKVALDTFGCEQAKVIGHRIERVFVPIGNAELDVERCSAQIISEVKGCEGDEDCEERDALAILAKCFINDEERVTFRLSNGTDLGPMSATVTLLDKTPQELSDITYIIYATAL